jgi:hypothetical protein
MRGLEPTKIDLKLGFANPSAMSMSSQTDSDTLVIKFDKNLVLNDEDGNSLVFDTGSVQDESIDFGVPIQP